MNLVFNVYLYKFFEFMYIFFYIISFDLSFSFISVHSIDVFEYCLRKNI